MTNSGTPKNMMAAVHVGLDAPTDNREELAGFVFAAVRDKAAQVFTLAAAEADKAGRNAESERILALFNTLFGGAQ